MGNKAMHMQEATFTVKAGSLLDHVTECWNLGAFVRADSDTALTVMGTESVMKNVRAHFNRPVNEVGESDEGGEGGEGGDD